jgi:hypothetical protein
MASGTRTGTSMGGLEVSPDRARRAARRRRRQEKAWARKCGPVTVRFDPSVMRKPPEQIASDAPAF